MWGQILTQTASGVAGWIQKSRAAKNQRKWDAYNNAMVNLQAGQAQNSIQENAAENHRQTIENNILIKRSALMTAARVKADAAASGVTGGSVNSTLFDVQRNAGLRIFGEETRYDRSQAILRQRSRGIDLQAQLSQQQLASKPSLIESVLPVGLGILKTVADRDVNSVTSSGTLLNGATQSSGGFFTRAKSMLLV